MQYGQSNGIGTFLAIAIGTSAFAAWLYVCYPGTAVALADQSRQSWSFLVLLGFVVVAVIGVSIASSVLQNVMMLLRSLVQLSMIVAVVVVAALAWRGQQPEPQTESPAPQYGPPAPVSIPTPEPPSRPARARWWEQNKSE
jgi:heme A synthase